MSSEKKKNILESMGRFLSLVLRHRPEKIGLKLEEQGWVEIDRLIQLSNAHGQALNRELLEEIVRTNDKKRFSMSEDGLKIRANQGHSVPIDLGFQAETPPPVLFHGTATRFEKAIRLEGLLAKSRHHVHLSLDPETARRVGGRHGKPLVLEINSQAMHKAGYEFFLSENQVWLAHSVPVQFISFP